MSRNWAVCIGINDYYNLPSLECAVNDAEAMRSFFVEEAFDKVFYFSDNSPRLLTPRGELRTEPTFANLKRFLRERFKPGFLTSGDNLWFFFAGHGTQYKGHDYLMPIDVDPGDVPNTALKISDITALLRNAGADNTVLLLDACRNQNRRTAGGVGNDMLRGVVTFYSCSPQQYSHEVEALQHGVFTYALLEAFRLQGEQSCATVERIDQYLRHQVPTLSKKHKKGVQTPRTQIEPISKKCLILLPQRARLDDVKDLKLAAYVAEIQNDWTIAKQLWVRVLAATPSNVDTDAVSAIGRIAIKQEDQTNINNSVTTAGSRSILESKLTSTVQPIHLVNCCVRGKIHRPRYIEFNISHTLEMQLVDIEKYREEQIIDINDWIQEKLDSKILRYALFGKSYLDVVLEFDEISNTIRRKLTVAASDIGCLLRTIDIRSDLEPLRLVNPFNLDLKNKKFRLSGGMRT